jgi:hypothetical protein
MNLLASQHPGPSHILPCRRIEGKGYIHTNPTKLKVALKGEFVLSIREKRRYLDFPFIRIP